MPLHHVVCESGEKPHFMFFSTTAMAKYMYVTEEGISTEVTVIGNEGVVGILFFLSNGGMINQAIVQVAAEG